MLHVIHPASLILSSLPPLLFYYLPALPFPSHLFSASYSSPPILLHHYCQSPSLLHLFSSLLISSHPSHLFPISSLLISSHLFPISSLLISSLLFSILAWSWCLPFFHFPSSFHYCFCYILCSLAIQLALYLLIISLHCLTESLLHLAVLHFYLFFYPTLHSLCLPSIQSSILYDTPSFMPAFYPTLLPLCPPSIQPSIPLNLSHCLFLDLCLDLLPSQYPSSSCSSLLSQLSSNYCLSLLSPAFICLAGLLLEPSMIYHLLPPLISITCVHYLFPLPASIPYSPYWLPFLISTVHFNHSCLLLISITHFHYRLPFLISTMHFLHSLPLLTFTTCFHYSFPSLA